MVASLLPNAEQVFLDENGDPLAGGFVYFYIPNTSTPANTWQDSSMLTLNTNPVVLDAAGRAIIYGNQQYRQLVTDSLGNTIWDQLTADVDYYADTSQFLLAANNLSDVDDAPTALANLGGLSVTSAGLIFAPLNSPAFTGNPTAPTQTQTDNSTRLATTAFVNGVARGFAQYTTGSGNFTTPATTVANTVFKFTLTGGGAGGAGGNDGAGGGAGSTAIYYATGLTASQACPYVIGAGGAGGASSNPGIAGSNSTLTIGATIITAPGGGAPTAGINKDGGAGGAACTNATISIEGGGGNSPSQQGNAEHSGMGGASYWGGGGRAIGASGGNSNGDDGKAWGSGASGGYTGTGGNGKGGILTVEYW